MRIRVKLQVVFMTTSIILATSLLAVTYFSMVNNFENQKLNLLKKDLHHKAKIIDNFMSTRVADFNVLSNNPLFSQSSSKIHSKYLTRVVQQYPFYQNLSFVDKNGITLSSSNQKFIGENILHLKPEIEDAFTKTLIGGNEEVYISNVSKSSQNEIELGVTLDIQLMSDVIDLNQNVIGVLVGNINTQILTKLLFEQGNKTVKDEYTYVLHNKVVLLSDNQKAEVLQIYPEFLKTNLQQKIESKKSGIYIYKNKKSIKNITGYVTLSKYGTDGIDKWVLLTTVPYADIMKPIYQIIYKAFFVFLFLMLLLFVFIINYSRKFSKPIVELEQAVNDFKVNRKPIHLNNNNKDEIGVLTRSFNIMTNNIYSSNITENKLTEEKEKKEKELNELKSRFVSTASHEFRTPLSTINLTAGFIKKYWSNMEPIILEKKLEKIENQVQLMSSLLDDLLIVDLADSGKIKNNPLHLKLGEFIDEIIEDVYISCNKSHEILLIDAKELKISDVYIDKTLGRNIFINLLSNAIKFSPEADKITIELSSEKDNILITVTDFGIGISKPELQNIFKAFIRGNNVDLIQGTGLGLTIVKDSIDLIGGEIIVKSTIGKGSSFMVKIPKKINK